MGHEPFTRDMTHTGHDSYGTGLIWDMSQLDMTQMGHDSWIPHTRRELDPHSRPCPTSICPVCIHGSCHTRERVTLTSPQPTAFGEQVVPSMPSSRVTHVSASLSHHIPSSRVTHVSASLSHHMPSSRVTHVNASLSHHIDLLHSMYSMPLTYVT